MIEQSKQFKYTWEEAIEILRDDPSHMDLIFNSYLTTNLIENCQRFSNSEEFNEVLKLLANFAPNKKILLDMPGGNGIATYAFAKAGFKVTVVDPNPSELVGRGAIHYVLRETSLQANVVDAYGEKLPFKESSFDIVYVRQGLHHADNLPLMLREVSRVLRPGGLLVACREHVVDNYKQSLKDFLDSQPDHQLYGGENAFTLVDYRQAIMSADLVMLAEIAPFDSPINTYPNTSETLQRKILETKLGKVLRYFIPDSIIFAMAITLIKRRKMPGRLYSFVAKKSPESYDA
jgi:SAM-dependent methyltransferase